MASPRRRSSTLRSTGTIVGVALLCAVIAAVYFLRVSPDPVSVEGSGDAGEVLSVNLSNPQLSLASVEEFPVQVLSPTPDPDDETVPGSDPDNSPGPSVPSPSSDPTSSPPPSGPTSPAPAPTSTGAPSGPSPAQPSPAPTGSSSASSAPTPEPSPSRVVVPPQDVPQDAHVVTVFLDGWSIAALGSNTLQGSFLRSSQSFPVVFTPLTARQVSAASASHPEDVSRYLSRLVTSAGNVVCSEQGCSAAGADMDPTLLADLSQVPVLGQTYQGAGLTYGLYAARVAVPEKEAFFILQSPGSSYTLSNVSVTELDGGTRAEPWPDSVALSYGFGYLFALDPRWGSESPLRWSWASTPYTASSDMFYDSNFSALFMYGLSDTYPSTVFTGMDPSLASYLTSPAVACGIAPICVTDPIEPVVTDFSADSGSRCLAGSPGNGQGRVGLLQQDFRVQVTLPYPVMLPGVSPELATPGLVPSTETFEPVSGSVSFDQRTTFIADEMGLLSFAVARDNPDPSALAWDRVLADELGPCPVSSEPVTP